MLNADGTSKDANLIDDIKQGTMKVNGLSIQKIVADNLNYFEILNKKEKSP